MSEERGKPFTEQEEEEHRDKDQRNRHTGDARRERLEPESLEYLDSDWAGRMILAQYLRGGGRKVDVRDDPSWTSYMTRSDMLRGVVWTQVLEAARDLARRAKMGRSATARRFHAEVENGEGIIGYQYLHGTNKDAGDFLIVGFGEVSRYQGPQIARSGHPFMPPKSLPPGGGIRVDFELTYVWNDVIDPNNRYITDKIKSAVATAISWNKAKSYQISIGWRNTCTVWLPTNGGQLVTGGYPEK
ncbi:hypothetical protein [Paludisphaera mucosa]|uniref:Bacterial EndoU nuclease domain-containing protein n=1 Tax=Paludisphaera mucosa TaxID=3030827 RepID=A0ABT6F7T2_9BACT|nr:hypothetical protein [Paludisphaera mucosa]MDG3003638.1 hypothetical protein [Paludisphaera mucosa]